MKLTAAILSGCTVGAVVIGEGQTVPEQVTPNTYTFYNLSEHAGDVVAVVINGEVRLMDRQDLDDIHAIEEAKQSGAATSYADFRKELGL